MLILLFCECFCGFVCSSVFLVFLCIFLSFCYVFFGFVVFSSQFATHFAIFGVAASQISRVSSILRLLLSILLSCLAILKSVPFSWLYVGLISLYLVQVLYRFSVFT